MNKAFLVLLMMLFTGKLISSPIPADSFQVVIVSDSLLVTGKFRIHPVFYSGELPIAISKPDEQKKKKLISAMLAFPFPLGFMGAHRVMLGCKPWIPVVYVATFGGCFGILPLIDFIAIITSKDIEQYENNPHVFMWLK
jgi:TM2 domain-containing membrane protein YozV